MKETTVPIDQDSSCVFVKYIAIFFLCQTRITAVYNHNETFTFVFAGIGLINKPLGMHNRTSSSFDSQQYLELLPFPC